MSYQTKKIIDGFSTCFRQHRAESHCRFLHGYALKFEIVFECENLNKFNWCFDYGGFIELKKTMLALFDHTTVISQDDPNLDEFKALSLESVIQLIVFERGVGCELFASLVFELASEYNTDNAKVFSVTCYENEHNSSTFKIN